MKLADIRNHLRSKGLAVEMQPETDQAYLMLRLFDIDFPLFIRLFEPDERLQLLCFMPSPLQEKAAPEAARLLHHLNKELDIPGFGMDEHSGTLFYRLILPLYGKAIDLEILEGAIDSIQAICQGLYPVIEAVARGAMTYDETLKQAASHG